MLYPVISYLHPLNFLFHIQLPSSHWDDRVSSEEESGPAEAAQESEIGSVPTETDEEAATRQETIFHSETAVEAATHQ